jgi:putative FmdB family regulatory protein
MTYEYLCTACQHVWEQEQSISEAPLKACPKCQKETAKRQVSGGAGFILKGGGWYSDLYSSTPKKSGEAAATTSGEPKSSGEAKKTDTPSTGASKDASSSSGGSGSSGSSGAKGGADSSAA